jgi:hypothetical protein
MSGMKKSMRFSGHTVPLSSMTSKDIDTHLLHADHSKLQSWLQSKGFSTDVQSKLNEYDGPRLLAESRTNLVTYIGETDGGNLYTLMKEQEQKDKEEIKRKTTEREKKGSVEGLKDAPKEKVTQFLEHNKFSLTARASLSNNDGNTLLATPKQSLVKLLGDEEGSRLHGILTSPPAEEEG